VDPVSFLAWRFYYFFRDPARRAPPGRHVLAPADGRVLYVTEVAHGEVPCPVKRGVPVPLAEWMGAVPAEGAGTLVGIYMTPLSVHYNRAPVPGRITQVVPRPALGENRSMARALMHLAWGMLPFDEAADYVLQNARNTIVIDGPVPVVLVQIADRYVNTIDCFVAPGDEVAAGDKVGLIRMGSQCDLFIPHGAGVTLTCRPGDSVVAGETILGSY
jgi:phosphatidylserine decarboxylase